MNPAPTMVGYKIVQKTSGSTSRTIWTGLVDVLLRTPPFKTSKCPESRAHRGSSSSSYAEGWQRWIWLVQLPMYILWRDFDWKHHFIHMFFATNSAAKFAAQPCWNHMPSQPCSLTEWILLGEESDEPATKSNHPAWTPAPRKPLPFPLSQQIPVNLPISAGGEIAIAEQ